MEFTLKAYSHFLSPLLFPLVSLILGIAASLYYSENSISTQESILYCSIVGGTIVWAYRYGCLWKLGSCFFMLLVGIFRLTWLLYYFNQFPFEQLQKPTTIHGTIINKSFSAKSRMKHGITLSLDHMGASIVPADYTILLYTPHIVDDLEIGDYIAVHNIRVKKSTNDPFNRYLMKEGIAATVFIEQPNYSIVHRPSYSCARWIFYYKKQLLASFKKKLSQSAFTFFSLFFLGEKETTRATSEKLQIQCKQWGILHYLARSGLHLTIVLSVYELLFCFLPVGLAYKYILFIILIGIYFLLSWSSVSFLRAFLLFIIYKLLSLLYIPVHFLHTLVFICMIILLINPFQLFFLDFQLSFCLTFALGWINQHRNIKKQPYLHEY